MKDYLQLIAVFAVLLLLIPCVGYARRESEKKLPRAVRKVTKL